MFNKMKIGMRLSLSFCLLIILMIIIIVTGVVSMNNIYSKFEKIVEVDLVRTQLANQMIDNAREVALAVRGTLLLKYKNESTANIQKMSEGWNESWRKYHIQIDQIKKIITKEDTERLRIINKIEAVGDSAQQRTAKAIEMALTGNINKATAFVFTTAYPTVKRWIQAANELIDYEKESISISYSEVGKKYSNTLTTMFIIGALTIALSILIVISLTFYIVGPLKKSVAVANSIASGDLTMEFITQDKREDEFGLLIKAFGNMIEKLRNSIKEIIEGVNLLGTSASEILAATTQVASGAAETATAISETTATVEEVRQAAQLSSQKASRVAENAQQVSKVTQTGQKAVDDTVSGMNNIQVQMESVANTIVRLSEQSQQIGGIIASVNDVADQSNLLAVNASIEAAKAGEQGKGFAVVAQEIKSLAQQSKQATILVRNILIDIQKATSAAVMATEQTSKAVENGVKQSSQAGESIKKLAESSSKAVEVATQIVASSQQQSVGMDQIGLAMNNINQAGAENAASMIQAEKAAKGLNELGQKLKVIVEQYKM